MSPAVEKADGRVVLLVHLTLMPGRDDSLIRLVRAAPHRGLAAVIREAMRSGTVESQEVFAAQPEDFELPDIGLEL